MQMRLELIPLPVSDVDRSIVFYADKLRFKKDFAVQPSEGLRIVQLTPEDSGCPVSGLRRRRQGADFSDPEGNTFELQQMSWRKGATYQELADSAPVGCGMNVPAVDFNR
jgi:predicted enzyme related to lactoylglutathione lyase